MYLIARDKDNNVDKVYGYVSITNIANYAKGKTLLNGRWGYPSITLVR